MEEKSMSQAEWQVMRVLWAHPKSSSNYIIQALQETYSWKPATIKTLIGRLIKKDFILADTSNTKFLYSANIPEEAHTKNQWQNLFDHICNTKHGMIIEDMIEQVPISKSDLQAIIKAAQEKLDQAPETITCQCIPGQCTCRQHA